jgi:sigma-54 dependent transcriptional regulator, acetoin dehydrogenase operon transcriptional activator AcoR
MIELIINSERLPPLDRRPASLPVASGGSVGGSQSLLEEAEAAHIRKVLAGTGNNVMRAARELGIGRNTLYRKIARFGIDCSAPGHRSKTAQEETVGLS